MVLPSSHYCKLQLGDTLKRTVFILLTFGGEKGNSDIFLSIW